jgi:hypothetical protein
MEMLNKAVLALSADAKPGTGPGLAHANQSLACLFAVSPPWLTGSAELLSDAWKMLNKAVLALSADAKPGTGPGLAHANQSLACLFAVSHPWLTGSAEVLSDAWKMLNKAVLALSADAMQSPRPRLHSAA